MKTKKIALTLLFIMLMMTILIGCGSNDPASPAEPAEPITETEEAIEEEVAEEEPIEEIHIRLANETNMPHLQSQWSEIFKEIVESESNGQISVDIYHGGQLGNQREMFEQASLNAVQIALGSSSVVELESEFAVFEFPFIFRDRDHIYKVLDGPIMDQLSDQLAASNRLRVLSALENGFRQITNNIRPIEKPEDLEGIKLRVPQNTLRIDTFNALGASSTPIAFTELFSAMQQNIVDGQENPLATIDTGSYDEVQQYLSISNHVYSPAYALVNAEFYDGLSERAKSILDDAAYQATIEIRNLGEQADQETVDKLVERGMEVNNVDTQAFVEALENTVWKDYEDELGDLIQQIVETN